MSIELNNKYGSIVISPEIIAEVAMKATTQCYGVIGLTAKPAKSFAGLLKPIKGVGVIDSPDGITLDLYVIIQYGVNMVAVAENIMDSVRFQIEHQLSLPVRDVNVHIEQVRVSQ
ncbi:MAG TPA: Asp23/Gls24 family envelope stress response protein [Tissierellia bacterium]|nr:Asp23/Gls24 family envelope stress response protein [Tissierellia bacterium]